MATKKLTQFETEVRMEKPNIALPMFRCAYCNHEWIPRQNIPKECPNCKRRNWYNGKKKDEDEED